MKSRRLDWKYIAIITFVVVAALLANTFRQAIIECLRTFFEFPELGLYAGGLAAIITIVHKVKTRKVSFTERMSFSEFRLRADQLLSFIGSPITVVCSLALAKGLFLQSSSDLEYFPLFSSVQLLFIFTVTAYLLFTSTMELGKQLLEIASKPTKGVTPSPVSGPDGHEVEEPQT